MNLSLTETSKFCRRNQYRGHQTTSNSISDSQSDKPFHDIILAYGSNENEQRGPPLSNFGFDPDDSPPDTIRGFPFEVDSGGNPHYNDTIRSWKSLGPIDEVVGYGTVHWQYSHVYQWYNFHKCSKDIWYFHVIILLEISPTFKSLHLGSRADLCQCKSSDISVWRRNREIITASKTKANQVKEFRWYLS